MLEVTELAALKIQDYLKENNIDSPVRVALMQGCGGMSLGLALDDKKGNDEMVEHNGLQILIDNDLLAQCDDVKIDFIEPTESGCGCGGGGGFSVTSKNPIGGGGCESSSCGSNGCGC